MVLADQPRYAFADLVLDMGRRQVLRGDDVIPLSKLTFELLRALVEASPNVLTHDELATEVWGPRRIVTPENLTQRLLMLRHSLGDSAAAPRYIESVRGHGYRLIPAVEPADKSGPGEKPPAGGRSATSRGRNLALAASLAILLTSTAVLLSHHTPSIATSTIAEGTAAGSDREAPRKLHRSIAVLPFEKLGPEPDGAFFAEAVHAELVNELGKNTNLSVIARATVLQYANSTVPVRTIANELNVETIMRGSVRYEGQDVHLIAELIDAATGVQLWTADYDAGPADVFAVQWDITKNIARALGARFSAEKEAKLKSPPTKSSEAYAFYLKAMDVFNENTLGSRTTAQTFLDQAIALDGKFAHAYAGKALVYAFSLINSNDATEGSRAGRADRERLARKYIKTALDLNPDTDLAYYALGVLNMFSWHWADAREAFERAIQLAPEHPVFLSQFAWVKVCALQEADGLQYAERATGLDPHNPYVYELLSKDLACLGDMKRALAATQKALKLAPTSFANRLNRAFLVARVRGTEDGLKALDEIRPQLTDQRILSLPPVATAYARLGREDTAKQLFDRFVALSSKKKTGPANWYQAYLAIGDYDHAYAALEKAVEQPGPGPGFYTLIAFKNNSGSPHPFDEPRFIALRQKLRSLH